jgi:hypothetical protein
MRRAGPTRHRFTRTTACQPAKGSALRHPAAVAASAIDIQREPWPSRGRRVDASHRRDRPHGRAPEAARPRPRAGVLR